jgi:hypothetical protein
MTSPVTAAMRRLVVQRAKWLREYCLLHQDDAHFSFQVDHIISRKHKGPTIGANLALACLRCNVAKGTDLGTIVGRPQKLTPLYHPRRHRWIDHFRIEGVRIQPSSDTASATVRLLELNASDRIRLRRVLIKAGRFPCMEALAYLKGVAPA